jgi:hypothetical protein
MMPHPPYGGDRWRVDHNPLRRRTDRIEAWLTVALGAIVLAGGPFVVWWCAGSAYDRAAGAAEWRRDHVFPVQALLLEDADGAAPVYESGDPESVGARWTAPNGVQRTGPVVPPPAARAGTTIVIWTDVYGNLALRPPSDPSASATGVGLASAALVLGGYVAILLAVRRLIDRRRMVHWQREWRDVEPRWSGRR